MYKFLKIFILVITIIISISIYIPNQAIAVTAITSNINLFKNLENKLNKQETFKEPVIIEDKVIFYVGENNLIDAKSRALNINTAIRTAINNNLNPSEVKLTRYNDIYTIYLGKDKLTSITAVDTKVNNMTSYRLARTWQRFIQKTINYSESVSTNEIIKKVSLVFCFILIVILLIHLIKKKLFHYSIMTISHLAQLTSSKEKTETEQLQTDEKITTITKDINKLINFIAKTVQILLILTFLNYLIYIIPNMPDFLKEFSNFEISILQAIKETVSKWFLSNNTWETVSKIVFIIILLYVVLSLIKILYSLSNKTIQVLFEENPERIKRIQTINKIITTTLKITLISIIIIIILGEIGLNITPILAGAGIIGLAISFGGQSLVKDIINGFFIVTENQFGIGDIVEINTLSGTVENMTLRITTLRDLSGRVHIIPNGTITNVTVYTKGWARANIDILISYKDDIDKAINILKEVAQQMQTDFTDKIIADPQILGISQFADIGVMIKILIDTVPAEQWFIEREYKRRIKYAFAENNIEIPHIEKIVYTNNQE